MFTSLRNFFSGAFDLVVAGFSFVFRAFDAVISFWMIFFVSLVTLLLSIFRLIYNVVAKITVALYAVGDKVTSIDQGDIVAQTTVLDYLAYLNHYIPIAELPAMVSIYLSIVISLQTVSGLKYWIVDRV